MKKLLPLLVVGVLVLSGLGVVAVTSKKVSTPQSLQPEVKILDIIGGLFVVEATVRNVGDEGAVITNTNITIDAPIMLRGRYTDIKEDIGLGSGVTIAVVSDLVIGLGFCTITYIIDIRDHEEVTATANGFVLGPFIMVKQPSPSLLLDNKDD